MRCSSRRAAVLAACAALVLAPTACAADDPSPVRTQADPFATSSVEEDGHAHLEEGLEPLPPSPTWDAAAAADSARVAASAMNAFARPDLDAATWWQQLRPWLTEAAASAYQDTDPVNVPARAVVGEPVPGNAGTAAGADSPYLATVAVPTDVGDYTVLLSRAGDGATWLVERLTPPESAAG